MGVDPRIALIHATATAMEPVAAALKALWPEAEAVNILDDSLSRDRAGDAGITPALGDRIARLAAYAEATGAAGILFTCSAFGPAIERAAAAARVPVLKPTEAMFEAAVGHGRRIGMIATFANAVAGLEAEFADEARRLGSDARLTTIVVAGALRALWQGDAEGHDRLIAAEAPRLEGSDAVVLAHFSTARAAAACRRVLAAPVLTAPDAAVARLRRLVLGGPHE